jgi:hypothetical protein
MSRTRPLALADVLDDEQNTTAGTVCNAPHHTDVGITCQRPADHGETAAAARDLHAAHRVWHDGDTEPSWATWS